MSTDERLVKNVAEYRRAILAIMEQWPNPAPAFRGQENANWSLESSAERRLRDSRVGKEDKVTDDLFVEYHERLIEKCKLRNYDRREGKPLSELELLADLQHHQTATCLLDFTHNALVALWFACEGSDMDGKVYVVNTANESTFLEITPGDIADKSVQDILEFKTRDADTAAEDTAQGPVPSGPRFWYWTPAHLNERITAQDSLFLFGPPSSGEPSTEEIIVESGSKEQIRQELEELDNVHEESLFPDFVGFAYTQRHDAPIVIPDSEEYLSRGIEAQQRGDFPQAIRNYNKAIKLSYKDSRAYLNRGNIYRNQGDYDRAIQDYNRLLELDPDDSRALLSRGFAYGSKGEYDRAIQDWNRVLALDPDNATAYYIRGIAYRNNGDNDLAIQDSNKALALDPDNAYTYLNRGLAYYSKSDLENAIQDYDKVLDLHPDNPVAYFSRGLVRLRLSEWANARSDLIAATDMGYGIVAGFRRIHGSVDPFERQYNIKLPADIASMLTTQPK